MKKLFLATSFSGQVNYETGDVKPEFRKSIEDILKSLRTVGGFTVFCAVEHEDWKIADVPPQIGVEEDLNQIDAADGVVALLHNTPSEGVAWEICYAREQGKPLLVATDTETKPGYFIQGLINLGSIDHVSFQRPELLAETAQVYFQ